ncbi:hypothetical protein RB6440 [Rhodopirellula baltica SH 1]|uniref:Uncharacterized protein n=1 Tax=Rhodopirellula baltica (strain DSM 10527 / NCIMB 13988 / SH1) TaxID=243090 RepID=Q7UQA2_RHOBA|nr:hypothetical protein RB6440 [Rhodopirellula baltica SH 1]
MRTKRLPNEKGLRNGKTGRQPLHEVYQEPRPDSSDPRTATLVNESGGSKEWPPQKIA